MPEQRQKVLVVDDDEQITLGAKLRLEQAGYEVFTAGDGDEGVSRTSETSPDLVVMDIQMPRVDGLTALAQLQSDPQTMGIPVVILSASLQDREAALDAGARFFVKKPYQGQQLLDAISRAMTEAGPLRPVQTRTHSDNYSWSDSQC